jgi:hypothetical protein
MPDAKPASSHTKEQLPMKAPITAFAALIALGLAAPAFAQNAATPATPATPASPAVTAPVAKTDKKVEADKTHRTTAQAPKKDEHSNKSGAVRGTDRAADVKANGAKPNDVKPVEKK